MSKLTRLVVAGALAVATGCTSDDDPSSGVSSVAPTAATTAADESLVVDRASDFAERIVHLVLARLDVAAAVVDVADRSAHPR